MMDPLLKIGQNIWALPVIHGSGDFALEVRRTMLEHRFDCVAVPLPASFQSDVEQAIGHLPVPSIVVQIERESRVAEREWTADACEDDDLDRDVSYVPVDPCQAVITALRIAIGEHIPRAFIDLETSPFEPQTAVLPDPYALKRVPLEKFAAAILPSLMPPASEQWRDRVTYMGLRLRELAGTYRSVLLVCSVLDWPWIRDAYLHAAEVPPAGDDVEPPQTFEVTPKTLMFLLGEVPFITGLYGRAQKQLESDENLSIDGVKELLVTARDRYRAEFKSRARKITPKNLAVCLKYIRNLTLTHRRLTPDLFHIVTAAKQVCGDGFALNVAETATEYPYTDSLDLPRVQMGIDQLRLPDGEVVGAKSRLPGPPVQWRSCRLQRRPDQDERRRWTMQWNPLSQCSWPPEDTLIENFRSHVVDRARQIMGADLIKTEKFTTSVKDGIDIRDTVRHWHTGELYVRILPPARGTLDAVVMLFDSPADPRDYPWRITWFAEHDEESTLAFYATHFADQMVGPGIGLATYGGALFLYPPVTLFDIWQDPRLDFAETLEERLLAAACLHSRSPQIALLSSLPPGAGWRRLASRYKKKWVHVPLGQFSDSTIQQLRMVHVLNGHQVRSYAAHFIRKA